MSLRIYQNNNAELDCPVSSAKADLNIDKVYPRVILTLYLTCIS